MVWSDPEIQQLSREFVAVADEVYMLYPEDAGNLARVKDDPAHLLFKRFGESMPPGDWHHPGTKQGIYMMGPDGEYLEGAFAASGDPGSLRQRLERALERWTTLRKAKKYANRPVPDATQAPMPPQFAAAPMVLHVSLRDLQDGNQATTPRWRANGFDDRSWPEFKRWAWNQNWFAVADPKAFVTTSDKPVPVAATAFRSLCREVLVDNVRGQAPEWLDAELVMTTLTMRRLASGKTPVIEYQGEARMAAGERGLEVKLYGQAEWDAKRNQFVRFDLLALGMRRGAAGANQRADQLGPSPIGIALRLAAREPGSPAGKK